MPRLFAIGDVHGRLDKLQSLMAVIPWDLEQDTLLFVGDYIDRGPDSAGVVEHILGLRQWSDRVVCLMGNHERLLLDFIAGRDNGMYLLNGGRETIESYGGQDAGIPEDHFEFFNSLPYLYETGEQIFVHAGLRDGLPLEAQDPQDLLWIRDEFIHSTYDHGRIVVFGHTPVQEPIVQFNKIGIDTGAVFGGRLTCVEFPGGYFYQV